MTDRTAKDKLTKKIAFELNKRTVKDVTPFEIIREVFRLGWEVHSADLVLYELDKIEAENKTLEKNIATLLKHGSFMDYKGRCEQYLHCRLCNSKWLWEDDEPSEHKDDCPLYADTLEGKP